MTRRFLFILLSIAVFLSAVLAYFSYFYLQLGRKDSLIPGTPVVVTQLTPSENTVSTTPPGTTLPVAYSVEPFVSELLVPWSLAFTSPTRILVTERPGKVRVVENGKLLPTALRIFPEVSNTAEEGLMGMTLDPQYAENHFVYLCLAYDQDGKTADKVIRLTDTGTSLTDDFVVLDGIPAAQYHAGCRLRFGPDGKLFISTGDATNKKQAQDRGSLGGKILRLNADGSLPTDNPFPNSPVFSFGHRNPQGFDWNPQTNALIATEHGPSGIDGPGGGDEVNLIQPGKNYGWPVVSHDQTNPSMESPLLVFTPAVAPASGMFYTGTIFPQLTNTFLVGLLKGEGILQVIFDPQVPGTVLSYQKLSGIDVGRVRDIVQGPDGYIYFTSSNRDGRGKPQAGDDKIYRLVPKR